MTARKSQAKASEFTAVLQEIAKKEELTGNIHINDKSESYPSTNLWTFNRYDVSGDNKGLSIVVKTIRKDPPQEVTNSREYFENEANFYSNVVPRIQPYLSKSEDDETTKRDPFKLFVPNYYGHSDAEGHKWLAIEDLSTDFVKVRDVEDLDKEHLKASMNALAVFHSALLSWKVTNPYEFTEVAKLFNETEILRPDEDPSKDVKTQKVHTALGAGCRASTAHLTGPYSLSIEKVYNSISMECPLWVSLDRAEPWGVITHGDCWAKNFLYKYDKNKKIMGVAIIDFKCARAASPLLDVTNFLLSSSSPDCLKDLRPFLEKHKDSMKPKITDYRRHVSLAGPYGVTAALVHHFYSVLYSTVDVLEATDRITNPQETAEGSKTGEKRAALVVKAAHDVRMI